MEIPRLPAVDGGSFGMQLLEPTPQHEVFIECTGMLTVHLRTWPPKRLLMYKHHSHWLVTQSILLQVPLSRLRCPVGNRTHSVQRSNDSEVISLLPAYDTLD